MRLKTTLLALSISGAVLAASVGSAFADDCMVANKPAGAGSAATVNFDTGAVTPNKPNPGTPDQVHGGFVTLTGTVDGQTVSADVFAHAPAHTGGINPGALQQASQGKGCDGKGLDLADVCFGG